MAKLRGVTLRVAAGVALWGKRLLADELTFGGRAAYRANSFTILMASAGSQRSNPNYGVLPSFCASADADISWAMCLSSRRLLIAASPMSRSTLISQCRGSACHQISHQQDCRTCCTFRVGRQEHGTRDVCHHGPPNCPALIWNPWYSRFLLLRKRKRLRQHERCLDAGGLP